MGVDFLPGNHIELLENGRQFFPALASAIAGAVQEVRLETYIFADDPSGRCIVAALVDAVGRGIAVRVLVDGFGAREFPQGLGRQLVAAGVQLEVYRPEAGPLRLRRHRLRRLHRKLAVIDGRIAFVGGINIIDDADTPDLGPRFDYAVRLTGPLAGSIHESMARLWQLVGWARLQRRPPALRLPPVAQPAPAGTMPAAFVIRDNLGHRRDIEQAYLDALMSARTEVLIANAYFLPGRRFRRALLDAAARGCRVDIVLQGQVEYALLHYATQALYGKLLAGGIAIHEYRAGFLHAKVAVIDGCWATVGSSNIDPFSLLLAREANIVVKDVDFARQLQASLRQAMAESTVAISHAELQRTGWGARILRWIAYGLVRLLLGITRYGGSDYRE